MNYKIYIIILNILFGPLLLFTYYNGLVNQGITGEQLWGGMPTYLRPISGISMIISSLGYFFFSYYLLARVNADYQFFNRFNYWLLIILYSLILIPSCLWMNLTIEYINTGMIDSTLWIIICIILYTVGIASLCLLIILIKTPPDEYNLIYSLSVIGCGFFTFHTLFLDGLLWTFFFNK